MTLYDKAYKWLTSHAIERGDGDLLVGTGKGEINSLTNLLENIKLDTLKNVVNIGASQSVVFIRQFAKDLYDTGDEYDQIIVGKLNEIADALDKQNNKINSKFEFLDEATQWLLSQDIEPHKSVACSLAGLLMQAYNSGSEAFATEMGKANAALIIEKSKLSQWQSLTKTYERHWRDAEDRLKKSEDYCDEVKSKYNKLLNAALKAIDETKDSQQAIADLKNLIK